MEKRYLKWLLVIGIVFAVVSAAYAENYKIRLNNQYSLTEGITAEVEDYGSMLLYISTIVAVNCDPSMACIQVMPSVTFVVNYQGERSEFSMLENSNRELFGVNIQVTKIGEFDFGSYKEKRVTFMVTKTDIKCTDSDNSLDYSYYQLSYPILPNKYPDLFTKGVGKGKYSGSDVNYIYGTEPDPAFGKQTSDPYTTYYDHCVGDQLNEAYCTNDGKLSALGVTCKNGCKDGACLKPICPVFTSPYCPNGKLVEGGYDENGCKMPPKCIPIACTEEAKICPDGTVVGRVPPNCDFETCPTTACQSDIKICQDGTTVGRVPPSCDFKPCPNERPIKINIPSEFTLIKGQSAKVTNFKEIEITLIATYVNPDCQDPTKPCPMSFAQQYAKVVVLTPGGCGVNADPSCLGPPGTRQEFIVYENSYVEFLGVRLTNTYLTSAKASFKISFQQEQVIEQVKCVFDNSNTEQECYSSKGSCKGVETCSVSVKGYQGEQVTWKSSCGGYAYTAMDGQNDYAKFSCKKSTCGNNICEEGEKACPPPCIKPDGQPCNTFNVPPPCGLCPQDCPNDIITEQVKCVFDNSNTEQECYSSKGSCKGVETCSVSVKGYQGEQVTWKSSCGGYANTIMDGQNDYAKFSCNSQRLINLNEEFKMHISDTVIINSQQKSKINLNSINLEEGVAIFYLRNPDIYTSSTTEISSATGTGNIQTSAISENKPTTVQVIRLREGEQYRIREGYLTLLKLYDEGVVAIIKTFNEDLVDIAIEPKNQEIYYGERAVYEITLVDKHSQIVCVTTPCNSPYYTYNIEVNNLPFNKDFLQTVTLQANLKTKFKLVINPYEAVMVEASQTSEVVSGNIVAETTQEQRVAFVKKASGSSTSVTSTSSSSESMPYFIKNYEKKYKFSVTATLQNEKARDVDFAVLTIKPRNEPIPPIPVPIPPEFPENMVKIKLYKGWNLISLPGKLVKFVADENSRKKLIGYIFLKDQQKYVSLLEAQQLLGDEFNSYLATNSFWIYSYNDRALNVVIDRQISYNDMSLKQGWNLVPITEDMIGGYLKDIKGDCQIAKLNKWNSKMQKWEKIDDSSSFTENDINYGFLIKTSGDCYLSGSEVISPPVMPE